jgi:hypothetical protein
MPQKLEDLKQSHADTIKAAQQALFRFLVAPQQFTQVTCGVEELKRCNEDRSVTFVELSDGSGGALRIEVFSR